MELKNVFPLAETLTFMGLFNSEVGNHSREYTQGNLGQHVSDTYPSMFPVALLALGNLAQMKKKCALYLQLGCERRMILVIYSKMMEAVLL